MEITVTLRSVVEEVPEELLSLLSSSMFDLVVVLFVLSPVSEDASLLSSFSPLVS